MAFRPRPSIVAAAFGVLFAVIANLAWATALTTTGPWFGATVSLQMYTVTLGVASFLAIVIAFFASSRATALDGALSRIDRRIALIRSAASATQSAPRTIQLPQDLVSDPGEELVRPPVGDSPALVDLEKQGHDALVELPEVVRSASRAARTQVQRELVRERIALREARARVWTTALGPVLMSAAFLAIAGPMLPGTEGFAAAHYQLNTTLVLFLAYGFAPLVAWSALTLGMLAASTERAPP